MFKIFFVNWRYWKVGNVRFRLDASVRKHKHSSNFPNYKNLMGMLVHTDNTFFGNEIYCFRLCCLNYKLRKDILPFKNLRSFWILLPYRQCRLFSRSGNIETESYQAKANQKGSAWHISWCNVSAYKWMGSHVRFSLVPLSIHSSCRSKLRKLHKANTATSVSTATINRLNPLFEASKACKSKRVSASSGLQGWSADKLAFKLLERTSSKRLIQDSTILAGILVILIASILNSSVLSSLLFGNA